jgi:ABC-2 type transport system ATP-binding protein
MIEVQSLSRYYGTHRAVDEVSFSVKEHAVVGILGLNGAGKTTTLKVLAGLLAPSTGTVRIDGVDLADAPVGFRKQIGFLPETPPLYDEMTVREFVRYVAQLRGLSGAEADARFPDVVQKAHLQGYEDRVISELSHGYRKRVGIAQVIIHKPRVVILDEPISGLDPKQIVEMREVVKGLAVDSTVFVSSHILSEIQHTCSRVLVLHDGKLVADGAPAALAHRASGASLLLGLTGDAAAATATLAAHPSVSGHTVTARDDGRLEATVELSTDDREALVAALVAAGLGLRRLEDTQDELEEIFMGLTKRGDA